MARRKFSETTAADVDVNDLPGYVTFVKLENLIELPIEITKATIETSTFDPEGKRTCAKVEFQYLDEFGDPLPAEDEVDESIVYQFTTEQSAIKAQVHKWVNEGVQWGEETVGPVTIVIYGEANKYGTHPLCFAELVPVAKEPVKRSPVRPSQPIHTDTSQDANRQRLAGKSIPSRANVPQRKV